LKEAVFPENLIGLGPGVVDGHLEASSVSVIDDSDGIGETEGRLGNGGAGKQIVAMRPCQQFGPHLKVEKPSLVRFKDGVCGHKEVESTVESLARRSLIRRVEGQEGRLGLNTKDFHSGVQGYPLLPQIL
jgi:hypothetical protein